MAGVVPDATPSPVPLHPVEPSKVTDISMHKVREIGYRVGEHFPGSGREIVFIYGRSDDVIVFRDDSDRIQWETAHDVLTPTQKVAHRQFENLYDQLTASIPDNRRYRMLDGLGNALFLALSESDQDAAVEIFSTVAGRIANEAQIEARRRHLQESTRMAGLAIAIFAALALVLRLLQFFGVVPVPTQVYSLIGGMCAGVIGAWTSLLQRTSSLRLDPFDTPSELKVVARSRVALGAVFGTVATFAVYGNLLLPEIASKVWILLIVQFLAGFSERLIPDLLGRLETQAGAPDNKK